MQLKTVVHVGLSLLLAFGGYARLITVPTVPLTETGGAYPLTRLSSIVVDSRYSQSVDHDGQTLIPPTLQEFAETFRDDLASSLAIDLPLKYDTTAGKDTIFITLGNNTGFQDAAGRYTSEGYELRIGRDGITISGASPLGAWWGTRSLIQAAALGRNVLPQGTAVDAPGWANRGLMLDVGRKYYPPEFIIEMCAYLSFFKQNVFHLHLSDNLWNDVNLYSREQSLHVYAAFRPWSDDPAVAGLNKRANESYTQAQFDTLQRQCANRGVTVIPEIEAPGHSLVIVQWKPELGLADLSMLNISYPETIPTMKTIWNTFLPWFYSKTVHIGADEYNSSLVADYTRYVNQMNDFIHLESGKAVRIWGTFTPKGGANVSKEVSIQHWTTGADNPYLDYIRNGYHVLNSGDWFYVVGKWSQWYPQELNATRVFHGNPDGGSFAPNIFVINNATYNAPRDNPMVLGQLAAVWNDNGPNATTVLEAYYSVRDVLPALGDKQWGGDLTEEEYNTVFNKLHAVIPGQNLDRSIPSTSDTILHYSFDQMDHHHTTTTIRDLSGNGYDGRLRGCRVVDSAVQFADGCYLETPLTSKGRDYTLSFWIKPTSSTPGTLFAGSDSSLLNGDGSNTNITLITGGNPYSLNYSLPVNTWTHVNLIGRGNATLLTVSDEEGHTNTMEFLTDFGTLWLVWAPIAIVAPLARIGEGFTGFMKDIVLTASAA